MATMLVQAKTNLLDLPAPMHAAESNRTSRTKWDRFPGHGNEFYSSVKDATQWRQLCIQTYTTLRSSIISSPPYRA